MRAFLKRFKYWIAGILLLLVLFLLIALSRGSSSPVSETVNNLSPDRFYTVKKADLIIGIRQIGFVNSQKSFKLGLEAAVSTKLLWIIPENSRVKAGELLAKFETDEQMEKIDNAKLEIDNLIKELEVEQEGLKILVSSNEASIKSAMDKVIASEDAYKKYRNFEKNQKRESLELDMQKANKSYSDNLAEYNKKKNEYENKAAKDEEESAKNEAALATLKQKIENSSNDIKKTEGEIKVFKRYTHPNKLTELLNQEEQAKLELNKIKISNSSQLLQRERAIVTLQSRLSKKQEQYEKEKANLELMKIVSPVDGVVIYGDSDRRWGNTDIRLGMDVRRGQILMSIPDMSKLIIEFDLPEQYRSKVKINDKVIITPEGMRQIQFEGVLSRVDQLPVNQIFWDRNSPKIYKSEVSLANQDPRLVCGMSVQLEIITREIKDTMAVPLESVFEEGGKYFIYKKTSNGPFKQPVRLGSSNDSSIQILEGVSEGDIVYLFNPFQRKESNS